MMMKKAVYNGESGFSTLAAHMRARQRERKQGGAAGHPPEFFKGFLSGLCLVGAIDADAYHKLLDFVRGGGIDRD